MSERLSAGTPAPDFTVPDSTGRPFTLSETRGTKVILYFYPAASTPACTQQACDFRDNLSVFESEGYRVLGISPEAPETIAKMVAKESLPFTLLADEDHSVALAYGAWGEKKNYGRIYEGLIRSTIVINEDGLIDVAQYNVRAKGHVAKLRRDLGFAAEPVTA